MIDDYYAFPWKYCEEDDLKVFDSSDIQDNYGFVYKIINTKNQKFYIGKKFFWKPKYRTVKGKKKRSMVESDWKDYWSSSKSLKEDISRLGEKQFERIILRLCKSKTECAYYELVAQIEENVLLREDSYNNFIGGKINGRNL